MKVLKYLTLALVAGLVFYGLDAFADESGNVVKRAVTALNTTFSNLRIVIYALGAFGLIGVAVGGIMGKINFKYLGYLAAGLAIVAGADALISYAAKIGSKSGAPTYQGGVDYTKFND